MFLEKIRGEDCEGNVKDGVCNYIQQTCACSMLTSKQKQNKMLSKQWLVIFF